MWLPVLCLWLAAGCGGNGDSGSSPYSGLSAGTASDQARYTIVLAQYTQMDSIDQAQDLMRHAKELLKTDDIWLLNDKKSLYVNYGHFAGETGTIEREFKRVKKMYYEKIQAGPYQFCFIREIPHADPLAPHEWDLLNSHCLATLEIGCYYNVLEKDYTSRKEDAVQAVKSLREAGETAFFIHGKFESRIYIGCASNPREAQEGLLQLQKKNPYRFENGGMVYSVVYDEHHKRVRIPKPSVVVDMEEIRRNSSF